STRRSSAPSRISGSGESRPSGSETLGDPADEERLDRPARDVVSERGDRREVRGLRGCVEDVAQQGRIARRVEEEAGPPEHELHGPRHPARIGERLVTAEAALPRPLPADARGRLDRLPPPPPLPTEA